jgi:hypothetical protein
LTEQARKHAERYLREALKAQRKLGYSGKVDSRLYEGAVKDAARAVDRLLRAQKRTRAKTA